MQKINQFLQRSIVPQSLYLLHSSSFQTDDYIDYRSRP
ncbi:unnamed protein product [Paramecium octaurelia]|uniref:Uncharacterized protein n=1 Tax=Paramecium octaurelia TaxID=43137 RepID=A0A8S1V8A5_PAROT|nr:unnamed protein product [Paramecium octaurelia]